jgi:hypothetical protein
VFVIVPQFILKAALQATLLAQDRHACFSLE